MAGYCTNKYYQTREVKDVVNCSNTQTRHSIIFNVRNEGCCSCISGGGAGHQLIRRNQTVPPVPPHSFIFSMISFGSSFKCKKGGEGARSDTHTQTFGKSQALTNTRWARPLFSGGFCRGPWRASLCRTKLPMSEWREMVGGSSEC